MSDENQLNTKLNITWVLIISARKFQEVTLKIYGMHTKLVHASVKLKSSCTIASYVSYVHLNCVHLLTFDSLVFTSSVSVTALSNQMAVGQRLILQCSVTTIRDINSRVDFVWISNGTELKRMEGVTDESPTNNLAIYTDHYIISQLSIADNNSLYTCEVIINRSPLISATGNFTLNITGKLNVAIVIL